MDRQKIHYLGNYGFWSVLKMVLVVSRAMRSKNHHSSSSSSSTKEEAKKKKRRHKILYTFNFQFSSFKKKAKVVDKVGKE